LLRSYRRDRSYKLSGSFNSEIVEHAEVAKAW
jgi:hypothetical protein